jgi:uncharacterized protein
MPGPDAPAQPSPLSELCQRCGLCCDGSLFTHAPLQPGEVDAMRQRKLEVMRRADGSPALAQRCAALEGCRCTIYTDRPDSCRRYQCLLYTALAEGEVSLDDALAVVAEARSPGRSEAFLDRHFRGRHGVR